MVREPTEMEQRVRDALIDAWSPEMDRDDMLEAAKAAIRSMRYANDDMRYCGQTCFKNGGEAEDIFAAMIDAASPPE